MDYVAVTNKYADLIRNNGGEIKLSSKLISVKRDVKDLIALRNPSDNFDDN